MNNVIKLLSVNKDFRMVVTDTEMISDTELMDFSGSNDVKFFLEQLITNCVLLWYMSGENSKISFKLSLSKDNSIFCQIENSKIYFKYSEGLNEFKSSISDLFDTNSMLIITIGDITTGIHTGTVEAHIDSVDMLFAHFMLQSEQLPSHFISADGSATRGVMLQPLPFVDEDLYCKADAEISYRSKLLAKVSWCEIEDVYSDIATLTVETKVSAIQVCYENSR